MKQRISRILLLAMLLQLCLPIANYVYAKENVQVIINDVCIEDSAYVESTEEKLYVSARSVADPMGLNLRWDDIEKTLLISHQSNIISLIAAANLAIVNNNPIEAELPLKIVSDRAVIDLGFLCDVLDAPMEFNGAENAYCITIDVPDSFEPDVIKDDAPQDEFSLLADTESVRVADIAWDLGLETVWEDESKSLTLSSANGNTLTLYVGDTVAYFNGNAIDCPSPLKIIYDEAYIDYGFIENLFSVQIPQSYTPAREIAEETGLCVEWTDENKTVVFTNENGDVLRMAIGSIYYTLNDKFYSNPSPMILKDGIAFADKEVVESAFLKSAECDEEASLFAADKEFSGELVFEKTFDSKTYINVVVISVQSIVYDYYEGLTYSDYNTKRITVPANTRTVDFSVTKTNCNSYDSYIIGYYFPISNDYYYDEGYLSYNGGTITYLSSYEYDYTLFDYYDSTDDIVLVPKLYSWVDLDDVVFSGEIKTNNSSIAFGSSSSLTVSVRTATYYGENTIAYTTLYPGNTTSENFSVSVPNNSSTRNKALYLCYELYNGNSQIIPKGYYVSSTSSTKNRGKATAWNIANDDTNNISFVVLLRNVFYINGSFYLPEGTNVISKDGLAFGVDILTVQENIYSQNTFVTYASYDNVAKINPGENSASYFLPVWLDEGDLYIFKYRTHTPQLGISSYGYATEDVCTTKMASATMYEARNQLINVDFRLSDFTNNYTVINNMPYNLDDIVSASSLTSPRNSYFKGYYIHLQKGETVTIEMRSSDFDSYLYLLDDNLSVLAYNDDGFNNKNSKITYYINKSGYYFIQAATYHTDTYGKFALNIYTDRPLSGATKFMNEYGDMVSSIGNCDSITANYRITNNKYYPQNVQLFLAIYDTDNALIALESKTIAVDDTTDDSITMNLKGISNIGNIKSFIWSPDQSAIGNADCLLK